jgi:hypothetical protein
VLIVGTAAGMEQLLLGRGWIWVCALAIGAAVFMLGTARYFLRMCLRVDERGVWQRRIFYWDLWTWEGFASGQIRHGASLNSFIDPSKACWNQHLGLLLDEKDRKYVTALINRVWIPPARPVPPEVLTIRWGLFRWAHLSKEGIQIGRGKHDRGRPYPWSSGVRVRMTRLDHSRRDCSEVELALPGSARPIVFRMHEDLRLWRRASPEQLAGFLESSVPGEHLLITAAEGPPETRAEMEWRLGDLNRMDREMRKTDWIQWVAWLGLVATVLLPGMVRQSGPNPRPWDLAAGLTLGMQFLLLGSWLAMVQFIRRETNNRIHAKQAQLSEWRVHGTVRGNDAL